MIASLIITFRETLEAALIVGIILGFLAKTKRTKYNNIVYIGVAAGITASMIGALIFITLAGGFEGRAEEIFEGVTMLVGAILLTTMILWMSKQKGVSQKIEGKVNKNVVEANHVGLFFLVFVSVLREGVETIIFLGAASFNEGGSTVLGALTGIVLAIILGYVLFVSAKRINIKKFFNITSVLLILFSAGLVAGGIHELGEAKILPPIIEEVWNINPSAPLASQGIYPLLHEKGQVGSLFKGLFGYNGNPSLIELIFYVFYLLIFLIFWFNKRD